MALLATSPTENDEAALSQMSGTPTSTNSSSPSPSPGLANHSKEKSEDERKRHKSQTEDVSQFIWTIPQWFRACWTKCPTGLQRSAGHFEPLSDNFPSWWLANITGHSCFSCPPFYAYWTLQDKMAGKVWVLCRTSAEICRHVRPFSRSLNSTSVLGPPVPTARSKNKLFLWKPDET